MFFLCFFCKTSRRSQRRGLTARAIYHIHTEGRRRRFFRLLGVSYTTGLKKKEKQKVVSVFEFLSSGTCCRRNVHRVTILLFSLHFVGSALSSRRRRYPPHRRQYKTTPPPPPTRFCCSADRWRIPRGTTARSISSSPTSKAGRGRGRRR